MVAARLSLVVTLCCAVNAGASAQTWSELSSLVFSPYRPVDELPLADALSGNEWHGGGAEPDAALLTRLSALAASVAAEANDNGANSPALIDELIALADVQQQLGEHADALVALERAQQILRRHEGLYSLEQVGIVEAMIASLTAAEDFLETLALERYLMELAQRNPDDPRVIELLTDIADRQMAASQYYLENDLPPTLTINIQSTSEARWGRPAPPPTSRALARATLIAARRNYDAALRMAIVDRNVSVADLLALEARVVDSIYFELDNADRWHYGHGPNPQPVLERNGRAVLEARLQNSRNFPGTPEAVARAMVELADWRLLFASHAAAMQGYSEAHRYMLDNAVPEHVIAELLSPAEPAPLPAFARRYSEPDEGVSVSGWLDVDVSTNRYGRVVRLEVVDRSPEVTGAVERRLRDRLYRDRYRPRLLQGEFTDGEDFPVRYYFRYNPPGRTAWSDPTANVTRGSVRRGEPSGT